jgi:molybdopterin-containing oxidoreductase family membrane subunit
MRAFGSFCFDCAKLAVRGKWYYWLWLVVLLAGIGVGARYYGDQLATGMVVTHLSDQVNWGIYIANFIFMGGIAAASIVLVIAAILYQREDVSQAALMGVGVALSAVIMSSLYILVDLGRPERLWHMIPFIGRYNFPYSLLSWDALVLNVYLLFTLWLTGSLLFRNYRGRGQTAPIMRRWVGVAAIAFVIGMVTVEAFLLSGYEARPFWNTAVLAPRFLAAAFVSGPAVIILVLQVVGWFDKQQASAPAIDLLATILQAALLFNLFLVGVEMFTHFYTQGEHAISAHYLYFGLKGFGRLVPWIWIAHGLGVAAVSLVLVQGLRQRRALLNIACLLAIAEIWIEKTMGLVIPGFIPTSMGEIFEYMPADAEIFVSVGVLSIGLLVFTVVVKIALPIVLGRVRYAA